MSETWEDYCERWKTAPVEEWRVPGTESVIYRRLDAWCAMATERWDAAARALLLAVPPCRGHIAVLPDKGRWDGAAKLELGFVKVGEVTA